MKKTKKKNLLSNKDMLPENIKVTVSVRLPLDVFDAYLTVASEMNASYSDVMGVILTNVAKQKEK